MKKLTTTGKTIEEATEVAILRLGVSRDRVEVNIICQPNRGLFGLFGHRDAEVEVFVKQDPIYDARVFLSEVLDNMGIKAVIVARDDENHVIFDVMGDDLGIIIGKHGQTLDAMQYLVNLVANRHSDKFVRIILDAQGYRDRRKEALFRLSIRLAEQAIAQKRSVVMEPMNAQERKIIHSTLQGRSDVATRSQGDEPYRRVVIIPKQ